ncbi:MAG: glycosyltransferase family 4 protein [Mojavia pulchra JT2-VF2]|jgi:glycosyltransferase involved in cell wall biosynthesis|uniref:Glycosyltransferase family 4 protein n=1 Tax=Mojavia pulchra JT2-VF2 TaxID=287848 RepID=A0A951UEV3_9NOST|nr:glycosyltransferase family 4 protein [Mojavia pulchra JT2-VF2]
MKLKKILVTGDDNFIYRYKSLFTAISKNAIELDYLPLSKVYQDNFFDVFMQFLYRFIYKFSLSTADRLFHKTKRAYIAKSQKLEFKIGQLEYTPDLVFHIFGMYSPFWHKSDIPYVMYIDYTMNLAAQNWSPWAPFKNQEELADWMECERQAYERAYHIFTFSNVAKKSLIADYNIQPYKINVVGSSGNFQESYKGEKTFGSQQILFNGSDFERKGGNLVLAAFKQVKQIIPNAKLVIIGKKILIEESGITGIINPGKISISELQDLFLKTDLVVAPAYCDPFPTFLLEAMNYGVPCVVTNKDGMPEIVEHQVDGIVISEMKADILAEEIINLLLNPTLLESFSKAARCKMITKYKWENIAKEILNILSSK